ncbi:serine hydrolase domain-containing protein [Flavivirga rizhaonensis]|uniref:Class C beta-lactamase-related serine hydrolase n=1 Tax=Flavivirga rizhaonensis TaxID=2559571 RepID=A0A4V6R492_9FLAO|nr:serine hydrolase [Flavivirga rizhaonensis]TGV04394.1 class C beta-lactamase-related serine hydrolase [Flavivirga rizhaonensis]
MKNLVCLSLLILAFLFSCSKDDSSVLPKAVNNALYFPPINTEVWETKPLVDLEWNTSALQPLLDYLENKNTKSFMILHEGRIVVEQYFGNHTVTSPWYWASAGKTLTTAISGIAQKEGLININNKVSDYLGTGWTSATLEKENLITCKNLLSMNSGLDDGLGDSVSPINLKYIADAGTRWAYHNVYVKMQDVVSQTSNQSWSDYFNTKLRNKIGMTGAWIDSNDFSVYWSNTRSMARFGLLIYANGTWESTSIIPENFLNEATNTSQNINQSYGYLWWLNGKSSYHLPASQLEFNGELVPNAPSDMYAALGKNDQKIYIVPSKKLVVIRMGNAADNINFALSSFDNDLWEKINALID